MSILYSFDSESEAIINPAEAVHPVQDFPETVLSVFSEKFVHLLASSYRLEQVSYMMGGRTIPIFCFEYKGERLGFYHSLLGGSASGALLEEIIAKGGNRSCFFAPAALWTRRSAAEISSFPPMLIGMKGPATTICRPGIT